MVYIHHILSTTIVLKIDETITKSIHSFETLTRNKLSLYLVKDVDVGRWVLLRKGFRFFWNGRGRLHLISVISGSSRSPQNLSPISPLVLYAFELSHNIQ